ncbi:MAG: patatin-like phospholipase family protein [Ignavibacteria bacterium]
MKNIYKVFQANIFKLLKIAPLFFLLFACPSRVCCQSNKIISLQYKEKKLPFGLTAKISTIEPSIALVLSGGGSRSLAQIGVLRALDEKNIQISSIAGTSMGSIIGGLYSAGYSINEIDSIVRAMPWNEFLTSTDETSRNELFVEQKITEDKALVTLRLEGFHVVLPTSINNGQRFSNNLNMLTLNAPLHVKSGFDELRFDFKAVCTNLVTGEAVVLDRGSLSQAMRASSSVTLFISPVRIDSLLLVDGGLVANVPVQLARESGNDIVIAFNTTSPLNSQLELATPWNVASQIVSIPMRLLSEQQLRMADVVISPKLGKRKNTDFSNIDSLIEAGYTTTLPLLAKIEKKIAETTINKLKEKEFFLKNITSRYDTELFEKKLINKYSQKDSVSNHEILNDLNDIYKSGDYDSLYVTATENSGQTHIRFIAKKNPYVKAISVEGITFLEQAKVDSLLSPLFNNPFNIEKIYLTVLNILKLYRGLGYSLAEIENLNFDNRQGLLSLKFSEGKILNIEIDGNQKTKRSIIQREFPIDSGDYFQYKKVDGCLASLRGTNLFNDISLTSSDSGGVNTLKLKVSEKLSSLVRFGLRIDNENRVQGNIDIRDENLVGTGTELGLIISGGERNGSYILEHKANRIFQTYLTYKLRAFYDINNIYSYEDNPLVIGGKFDRLSVAEYQQINKGFSLGFGMQAEKFGNLIVEGKYQNSKITNIRDFNFIENNNIFTLAVQSAIDNQDKYPFPNKGFLVKAYYETAQNLFVSDIGYTKIYFDYTSHITTSNEVHSFSPRVAIGFADNTLPLSQQFSFGGQNSFFGLRDYEFRGRQIFLSSLEYRVRIPLKVFFDAYLKLRYDLGSSWVNRELIRFSDLRHGAGATLSLDTPLGPAEFSVGRSFLFRQDKSHGNRIARGPVFFYFTIGYYY